MKTADQKHNKSHECFHVYVLCLVYESNLQICIIHSSYKYNLYLFITQEQLIKFNMLSSSQFRIKITFPFDFGIKRVFLPFSPTFQKYQ